MKRNTLNSLFLIASIVLISACKSKKEIVVAPKAPLETEVDRTKAEMLAKISAKQLKFNTLALKAKASLDIAGKSNDVTMNFRIKDKEVIWVSITALGGMAEVARALITPDSVKIINRFQSQYVNQPFSYLYRYANKQLTFNTLQAILVGNASEDLLNAQSKLNSQSGGTELSGRKGDLDYRLLFNTLLKVSESNLSDSRNGQSVKVNYTDYQKLNDSLFPSALEINTLSKGKTINIILQFTKIDGNVPLEFPFTVPKRFTEVN